MLLDPPDGAITPPLQQFPFAPDATIDDGPAADGLDAPGVAWWRPQVQGPDRSRPQPVVFRWLPPPALRQAPRYDLLLGLDAELSRPVVVPDLPEATACVHHLFVGTEHFWRVVAKRDGEPIAESRICRFRTHPALPRWIRVPEVTNVRDLGGWPTPGGLRVRQGLIYRSSELNQRLELSAEGEAVLLRELRIRTDLDLRGPEEDPEPALPGEWVRYVNVPFLPYERLLEAPAMASVARIFEILAAGDSYPVLMHCRAGADRAGTAAFLLHAALGVQLPDLAADYELSSLSVWGVRSRHGTDFQALLAAMGAFAHSPDASVSRQVENYLRAAGVPADALMRLRAMLLEPAPAPVTEVWS
jgi:protein-tyrosine phosphatase